MRTTSRRGVVSATGGARMANGFTESVCSAVPYSEGMSHQLGMAGKSGADDLTVRAG